MPWMPFLLATTLSRAAHSWQFLQHKEGSLSSAGTSPQTSPQCMLHSPMLLDTHCAHTKFPQISPSANWAPKCTFTVQTESKAVGDKGNMAPILWSPIQYSDLEWLQTVQGSLLYRLSPGWPGWELATGVVGGEHTMGPCHTDTLPATYFFSFLVQPCPQSAFVNTAPIFCWQYIFFLTLTFFTPTAWALVDGDRSTTISYKEHMKTNDVVQFFTTFV